MAVITGSGKRQTLAADGQTDAKAYSGPIRLSLTGTFGGGTAQLQARDPQGNWVSVAGGAFTAVTDTIFDFTAESQNILRVDISSSTTPALVVWIQGKALGGSA